MNVKAEQICEATLCPHKGAIFYMKGQNEKTLKQIATCDPMWANLLSGSALMFDNLQQTMQFFEYLLQVLENQGLDKLAHNVTQVIAAQKLIEKRILQGPEALTAIVSKPK